MQALDELQRRLWRLISAPEGVAEALASEPEARAPSLSDWIVDDAQLGAARRLEVYANAYFARIHECLARDFAALAAAIGEAGFHDLVTAYLIAHPSRHPSLRFIGAALPDYLADAPQAAPFRRRWPWAADLARLEWALGCAFDAADAPARYLDYLARCKELAAMSLANIADELKQHSNDKHKRVLAMLTKLSNESDTSAKGTTAPSGKAGVGRTCKIRPCSALTRSSEMVTVSVEPIATATASSVRWDSTDRGMGRADSSSATRPSASSR